MKRVLLPLSLGIVSLLLLISLNVVQRRAAAAELALTESARAAAAEAAAEIESLTLTMDKLLVTASPRQTAKLLAQATISADRVQSSIAALPDAQGQQSAIQAFLSRLSSLCQISLADLAEGDPLESQTRSSLASMRSGLRLLQAELSLATRTLLLDGSDPALPATELTAPPTALELNEYKALPSREVGVGEAMQLAKEFVGQERVLSVAHAADTSGALPAHGVTIQTRGVQLNLEVTRQGGKILLMSPETAGFSMLRSVEECRSAALAFLTSRGFPEMEAPYYQVYDGLCVITCVYVQEGVLIWPDRVTVQVRMDTAEVVGIEARSFWKNHIPRKLQSPLLTETEARQYLSSAAEVQSVRLCLLPYENTEQLCWQFTLAMEEGTYISYIDAITGQELQLEKIMQLEFGAMPA